MADTLDLHCPRCHIALRLTVERQSGTGRTHWACPACGALERHDLDGVVVRVVVRYDGDQASGRTSTVSNDT